MTEVAMTGVVRWVRLDRPGREQSRLRRTPGGWTLSGDAVVEEGGRDFELAYEVVCDETWRTIMALVECRVAGDTLVTTVHRTDGTWKLNGVEAFIDESCLDVDLAFTPATNALPIRRLNLAVGDSANVTAAWLTFPEFELRPLDQVYTRESPTAYRYASNGGAFERTLTVDGNGLVVDYPGLWRRDG